MADSLAGLDQEPLLITWINFIPSMDKYMHIYY